MIRSLFRECLIRSWWVIAFLLSCAILYEHGLKGREENYQQLKDQLHSLQQEKQRILLLQQDLILQINSQGDLAWVELTLKKGLGLVPENEQKVYFYQDTK